MKRIQFVSLVILSVISTGAKAIVTIPTVLVGNPGNPAMVDGVGSVSSIYRIGTYEVTNAQYAEFLNHVDTSGANQLGLYNTQMADDVRGGILFNAGAVDGSKYLIKTGRQNNPVIFVSWYDSVRFANWLNNGQGNATTESGAYTLLGGTPAPSNGDSIVRNPGAIWFLPTESEWAKAAFHKNDGVTNHYWIYPTQSNTPPDSDKPPGLDAPNPANTANFRYDDGIANGYNGGYAMTNDNCCNTTDNTLSDVGAYSFSSGPYGTFDQGGNVREWNSTFFGSGGGRGLRGGSWGFDSTAMHAFSRTSASATLEGADIGFRVAFVPEPASAVLLLMAGAICAGSRNRPRRHNLD